MVRQNENTCWSLYPQILTTEIKDTKAYMLMMNYVYVCLEVLTFLKLNVFAHKSSS